MHNQEFGRMLDGHLDPEVVSDLVSGGLTPEQAESLEQHFATCPECRELRDSLFQVRDLLAHLPAEPMPAAMSRRIDRALAAESKRRSSGATAGAAGRSGRAGRAGRDGRFGGFSRANRQVRSFAAARDRRRDGVSPLLRAAAAALVIVAGGVIGFAVVDSIRSTGSETGSETGTAARVPQEEQSLSGQDAPGRASTASGGAYTQDGLDDQVLALLAARSAKPTDARSDSAGVVPQPPGPAPKGEQNQGGASAFGKRVGAQPCVLAATGRPGTSPLAVDLGTYQGRPAAVVVLPAKSAPNRVDVYVVDSTCTGGKGELLLSRQLIRR